jgi:hypothetical protein
MSGCCLIKSLRATLNADRAAYRSARNRLILAEARLLPALADWQDEGEPAARAHFRWFARREAKAVRRARTNYSAVVATIRGAKEALHEAMTERAR